MRTLDRKQVARFLMFLVLLGCAAVLVGTQFERAAQGEQRQRLALLQTASIDPGSPRSPALLRRQIDEADAKASEVGLAFPARVDPLALQDHVLRVAMRSRVQLVNLNLNPAGARTLAGGSYTAVTLTLQGRGDLPDLFSFLSQVESSLYDTTLFENLKVSEIADGWSVQFDAVVIGRPSGP